MRDDGRALAGVRTLEALLVCAGCPVRTNCLREAFATWKVAIRGEVPNKIESSGIWGGTTERERESIRHLAIDERIQALEEGFPARLAKRVSAFEQAHPADGKHRHCRGKRCARARKLLNKLRADSNV
jgi:hypothetical protein